MMCKDDDDIETPEPSDVNPTAWLLRRLSVAPCVSEDNVSDKEKEDEDEENNIKRDDSHQDLLKRLDQTAESDDDGATCSSDEEAREERVTAPQGLMLNKSVENIADYGRDNDHPTSPSLTKHLLSAVGYSGRRRHSMFDLQTQQPAANRPSNLIALVNERQATNNSRATFSKSLSSSGQFKSLMNRNSKIPHGVKDSKAPGVHFPGAAKSKRSPTAPGLPLLPSMLLPVSISVTAPPDVPVTSHQGQRKPRSPTSPTLKKQITDNHSSNNDAVNKQVNWLDTADHDRDTNDEFAALDAAIGTNIPAATIPDKPRGLLQKLMGRRSSLQPKLLMSRHYKEADVNLTQSLPSPTSQPKTSPGKRKGSMAAIFGLDASFADRSGGGGGGSGLMRRLQGRRTSVDVDTEAQLRRASFAQSSGDGSDAHAQVSDVIL